MQDKIKEIKKRQERLTKEYDKAAKRKDKFLMGIILEALDEDAKILEGLEKQ